MFEDGEIADAYLAVYALWLADRVGAPRVDWAFDSRRTASRPWFSGGWRARIHHLDHAQGRPDIAIREELRRLHEGS